MSGGENHDNHKRLRQEQDREGQDVVTRASLEELLASFQADNAALVQKEVRAAIEDNSKRIQTGFNGQLASLLRQYDDGAQKRFAGIECALNDLDQKHDMSKKDHEVMDKQIKTMQKDIERLQEGLLTASSANPSRVELDAEDFERNNDFTVIRVSAADQVSIQKIKAKLNEWLSAQA